MQLEIPTTIIVASNYLARDRARFTATVGPQPPSAHATPTTRQG
jgi:hypothetical protein